MFPNPVVSVLHFDWSGAVPKLIEIQDAMGHLLHRETITPSQTIDLGIRPQGVYFVRIDGKTYPVVKH